MAKTYALPLQLEADTFKELGRLAKVSHLSIETLAHGLLVNGLLLLGLSSERSRRQPKRRVR